jgi:hypothetical protein
MTDRSQLPEWTAAAVAELGLDVQVDIKLVLDLARDAAHAVERPAAPITTYLLGIAAAQRSSAGGIQASDVEAVSVQLTRLAQQWSAGRE